MRNGFEKESAKIKGNQVEILSDPVTVFREYPLIESIVLLQYEKEKGI